MSAAVNTAPRLASRLVNGVLAIKPLANLAKHQARQMMIKRAEKIGVPWTKEVQALRSRDWEPHLAQVQNTQLTYPDYYRRSFHAYDQGNLCWEAALIRPIFSPLPTTAPSSSMTLSSVGFTRQLNLLGYQMPHLI